MGLVAYINNSQTSEKRGVQRRTLRLEVDAVTAAPTPARLMIHDLSPTGLLVEADDGLTVGEQLHVELPGSGTFPARVMWSSGRFTGCKFDQPLPRAAISAALLKGVQTGEQRPSAPGELGPVQELQARVQRSMEVGEGSVEATSGVEMETSAGDDRLPLHVRGRIMLGLAVASAAIWAVVLWALGVL